MINGWTINRIGDDRSVFRFEAEKNGYAERFTCEEAALAYARRTPGRGY